MTEHPYVRVATKRRELVYHRRDCRHVAAHRAKGAVVVPAPRDEVLCALQLGAFAPVIFEGMNLYVHVCRTCMPNGASEPRHWPPLVSEAMEQQIAMTRRTGGKT